MEFITFDLSLEVRVFVKGAVCLLKACLCLFYMSHRASCVMTIFKYLF